MQLHHFGQQAAASSFLTSMKTHAWILILLQIRECSPEL
jgi:hypothetical protein